MHPNQIVTFEFLEEQKTPQSYCHEDPVILLVLEGTLGVTADGKAFELSDEDFLLVNANRTYDYVSQGKLLAVRFHISMAKISETLRQGSVLFWCCSAREDENPNSYDEMRQLLKNIVFYSINSESKDEFYVNSICYQLLSLLCNSFLLSKAAIDNRPDDGQGRMTQVMDYICLNYRNPISLKDVADDLYLSPTYLSKYIRKESGKGFIDLINTVRLSHAFEDLMYTDNSVLKIATDNGFASVAAFDKAFKAKYDETPSKYRKRKVVEQDSRNLEKVAIYLHNHLGKASPAKGRVEERLTLTPGKRPPMALEQVLNVGRASDLLNAATQKQILYCQENLHMRYVRFWNVFDADMHLGDPQVEKLNFGRLDEILDFLVDHGLRPYVELRSKPFKILETANQSYRMGEPEEDRMSKEERVSLYGAFFGHLVSRFGRGEVSGWIFDYPIANGVRFEGDALASFSPINDQAWETYLDEFDQVASCLKRRVPTAEIGGADFAVQHYGQKVLWRMFGQWKQHAHKPSFISFTSFPYQVVQENGIWYERRRTDFDFVTDAVSAISGAVEASGIGNPRLILSECNLTLSDRSYINDTLMRGAFIANVVVKTYGKLSALGIWNMRDAYSDSSDTSSYLFGGSGILTKSGIPKPACYALDFMGRLYQGSVWAKGSCLVSSNEHGHYKMLVHHLVNMNAALFKKEENRLSALGMEQMTETDEHKLIHVRIENLEEGCWQIRRYCLNLNNGSVLNECLHLDMSLELGPQELEYLERICVPRLLIQKQMTHNGVLEFDIELEPNEVQYLHVTEFN